MGTVSLVDCMKTAEERGPDREEAGKKAKLSGSKMAVQVVEAEACHASSIRAMIVELAEYEKEAHQVRLTVEQLAADLEASRCYCLLAVAEDGAHIGYALVYSTY